MYPYVVIFGRNISTYGIMAMIGIIAVVIYSLILGRIKKDKLWDRVLYIIYAFFFSLVGGAVLYILTTLKTNLKAISYLFVDFEKAKEYFTFGIVFYGGLIGIFIGMLVYTKLFGEDTRRWLMETVPSIPLFHVFGRIGCLLGGCCYGRIMESGGVYNAQIDACCFPIQLVEAGGDLIIFFVLLCVLRATQHRNRYYKILGIYFVLYGTMRFILEFFRGDLIRGVYGGLSTSQYISILIVPFGIYCIICKTEKNILEKWYNGKK